MADLEGAFQPPLIDKTTRRDALDEDVVSKSEKKIQSIWSDRDYLGAADSWRPELAFMSNFSCCRRMKTRPTPRQRRK